MNHAFLIMAYNNPTLLGRICHRLEAENHFIFIHIDKKSDLEPFCDACKSIQNLIILGNDERIVTNWGGVFTARYGNSSHKKSATTFLPYGLLSSDKRCRLSLSKQF